MTIQSSIALLTREDGLYVSPVKQEKLIKSNCRHIFLTLKLNTIKGIKIVLDFQVEAIISKTKVK